MLPILSAKETDSLKAPVGACKYRLFRTTENCRCSALRMRKTGDRALFSYIARFDGFEAKCG